MESLHCIICFEEFTLKERPPVVLPCGHTYVCSVCAQRIKRCMECREPLYWKPPMPKNGSAGTANNAGSRIAGTQNARYGRYASTPQTPPAPALSNSYGRGGNAAQQQQQQQGAACAQPEQVPLPLPKNLVLMEFIEQLERKSRLLAEHEADSDEDSNDGHEAREGTEDDLIKTPIDSACGTYAVKEPNGLVVLPFDPNRSHHFLEETFSEHGSTDGVGSGERHGEKDSASGENFGDGDRSEDSPSETFADIDENDHGNGDEEKKDESPREPFVVEHGHSVQVVDITDDGVYKLARGRGFIVASSNQLVKVGGPLDDCCRLEGMRAAVRAKESVLARELEKMRKLSKALKEDIIAERRKPETHEVVSPPVRSEEDVVPRDSDGAGVETPGSASAKGKLGRCPSLEGRTTPTVPATPTTMRTPERMPEGLQLSSSSYSTEVELGHGPRIHTYVHSPAHSCPMPTETRLNQPYLDENQRLGLPAYRISNDDDLSGLQIGFGCGTALFGENVLNEATIRHPSNDNLMSLSFDDGSLVDDRSLRHQAGRAYGRSGATVSSAHSIRSTATPASTPVHVWGEDPTYHAAMAGANSLRSGSFDGGGINWRTGMSGHRGLQQSRKKNVMSPSNRRSVRFMSVHRGIAAPQSRHARTPISPNRYPFVSDHHPPDSS